MMINYSELSDFEINKLVARNLGFVQQGRGWITNADGIYDYIAKPNDDYRMSLPDYCNNPADAWPIISENEISIAFDKNDGEWTAWGDFEFDMCGWDMINEPQVYHSHANPLRATMIVFLMMQDAKK